MKASLINVGMTFPLGAGRGRRLHSKDIVFPPPGSAPVAPARSTPPVHVALYSLESCLPAPPRLSSEQARERPGRAHHPHFEDERRRRYDSCLAKGERD